MTVLGLVGRCGMSVRAMSGALAYALAERGCRCLIAGPSALNGAAMGELASLPRLPCGDPADLVLVLDARGTFIPKIEVWRDGHGGVLLCDRDPSLLAIAAEGLPPEAPVPVLDFCDPEGVASFVAGWRHGLLDMTMRLHRGEFRGAISYH